MRRNTDSQFYTDLIEYLELKLTLQKDTLVSAVDMDEIKRIQGRCLEISDMLKALTRKPVQTSNSTGSFNT